MQKAELILILLLGSFVCHPSFSQSDSTYWPPDKVSSIYLDTQKKPKVKLPDSLRIDSIQGRIVIYVKVNKKAEILGKEMLLISLKNADNKCFIEYDNISKKDSGGIKNYPAPIRPYVRYFREKTNELKFKIHENMREPKASTDFLVTYDVY